MDNLIFYRIIREKNIEGLKRFCKLLGIEDQYRYLLEYSYLTERGQTTKLLKRWEDSIERGTPDFDVYNDDEYTAELWLCWIKYSRKYLRNLRGYFQSIKGRVNSVIDLGCGFGYTTIALKNIFNADVSCTNIPGTKQYQYLLKITNNTGIKIFHGIPASHIDLVFASEYFEHISNTILHIREVIEKMSPRYIISANSFGTRAVGHFNKYDEGIDPRSTSRIFGKTVRSYGYIKKDLGLWNNRPSVWEFKG